MAILANFETGQDNDAAIGDVGGNELRRGQSFVTAAAATITTVELYLKDGGGPPTDDITVRVETDSSGVPSGTLADVSASTTINDTDVTGSYAFVASAAFTPFTLPAGTYHLVASVPNQSSGVHFLWGFDTEEGYASGTASTSTNGGAWANNSFDLLFRVNGDAVGTGGGIIFISS